MLTFEDDPFHSTPSPLSDIQPTDPPSDTDSFESYIDQSFCSNFSCCGQSLPDLHRLLEHFEDEHVLPISIPYDSRPLYSTPVYARPSGPHASYILSYPQPDPPLQPVSHPIPAPRPLHDRFHMSRIPLGPAPDLTYSSPASSCDSPPNHAEPLCLPPALFTFQNPQTRPRTPPLDYDDLDDDESDHSLLVSPPRARVGVGAGPHRSAKQARSSSAHARSRPVAPTHAPATAGQACAGSRRSRREGREKAYKCPHPGCMKSYLNPNGLKYHLEKGTCTNADERERAPLPSFVTIAAMPAVPSTKAEAAPPSQPPPPLPHPPPSSPVSDASLPDFQRQSGAQGDSRCASELLSDADELEL